jgi:hypothetical protein
MAAGRSLIQAYLCVAILLRLAPTCDGGRFLSSGPFLTVTLKDSHEQPSGVEAVSTDGTMVSSTQQQQQQYQWFNLGNFRPSLMWSLQSQGKPLPNWLPNWQSLRTTVGYQYESLKRMPSFVEADLKFSSNKLGVDLEIQPSHDFGSQHSLLVVQASRGAGAYLMAKFATKKERWLQLLRGCYQVELPYASVGAVRVTPTWDLARGQASCLLEGTTGSQRTKAVLNLEYDNPTLTVIHSLDERYVAMLILAKLLHCMSWSKQGRGDCL